ncbi:MAG: hypothetical protein MJB14_06000, partial [Spirochaetes bacterium]|nr:hypothetical protein [Spirochaetota bacterium]
MNKNIIIKRVKNHYLYDTQGNRYWDLQSNSNYLDFSAKKLTHTVKNALSVCWQSYNYPSLYHIRYEKLLKQL